MSDNFEKIRSLYKDGYRQHGDSPKALLTPKGRNSLRYRAIDSFVVDKGIRVLDYGCGLGYLYGYLLEQGREVSRWIFQAD
jgi:2-polyprenyl-3-methyl-5-hydroxy-6-metoxy-1,4-benzoquinol methylase